MYCNNQPQYPNKTVSYEEKYNKLKDMQQLNNVKRIIIYATYNIKIRAQIILTVQVYTKQYFIPIQLLQKQRDMLHN